MAVTDKCSRCGKKYRGRGAWNMTMKAGAVQEILRPRCQTPAENAEAEINEATLDYFFTQAGLVVGRAKR